MPSIEILSKHAGEPSSPTWEETRESVAGNGAKAVFHKPFEFHMGAYSWELEVSGEALERRRSQSGLICLHPYQPWSHDSACLFLASWKEGPLLYEIASGSSIKCALSGLPNSALGSRRFPRFLAVTDKENYLLALDGSIERVLPLRRSMHGYPCVNWFDKAGQFFAVEKEGPGRATLRFFDGQTGEPTGGVRCDPNELFPYDEAKYGSLNRDSFALILSGSTQCVASLLDEWSAVEFHENTDVLKMRVYRPVGEIFEKRGQPVCAVEEHWVEMRLRP